MSRSRQSPFVGKLYTYILPIDDGAAPNPFWGVCTLAICKPQIRRAAVEGDWVVGLGAKHTWIDHRRGIDMRSRVIYAMRVTAKMSMEEYDQHVRSAFPEKCPTWSSAEHNRRLGDSIYDFTTGDPRPAMRESVHTEANRQRDLSGKFVLLSDDFYYFGKSGVMLPDELRAIAPKQQEFRSKSNTKYLPFFQNGYGLWECLPVSRLVRFRLSTSSKAWR